MATPPSQRGSRPPAPQPSAEVVDAIEQQWNNTVTDWSSADAKVLDVHKAARESEEHARNNHPEHLDAVRSRGERAVEHAQRAVKAFGKKIESRQYDLQYARGRWPGPEWTDTLLRGILVKDQRQEALNREEFAQAIGKAMDIARVPLPEPTTRPVPDASRAHTTPTLYGPPRPKARGHARTTVSAARSAQRRQQQRRGRTQS